MNKLNQLIGSQIFIFYTRFINAILELLHVGIDFVLNIISPGIASIFSDHTGRDNTSPPGTILSGIYLILTVILQGSFIFIFLWYRGKLE